MNQNGEALGPPAIKIHWDQKKQQVSMQLDPEQVKNWDMALGILSMAEQAGKDMRAMVMMQSMQEAQREAQRVAQIRNQIKI